MNKSKIQKILVIGTDTPTSDYQRGASGFEDYEISVGVLQKEYLDKGWNVVQMSTMKNRNVVIVEFNPLQALVDL